MLESYSLGAPQWAVPAILISSALLLMLLAAYWGRSAPAAVKTCAMLLKLLAIAGLAICLLEPVRHGQRPRPHANLMAVVVDNSQSMRIKTAGQQGSDHERLKKLLVANAGWRTRLEQDFDVRSYAFDSRLGAVDDLSSLEFDGPASALGSSIQTIAARFKNRPVADAADRRQCDRRPTR
jgi:hypothetical protein